MAGEHRLEAEVLTPEGPVFSGEIFMLATRTTVGEVGIRARHAPMIARLEPTELRLHTSESEIERFAQGEGWLEVFANRARVLVAEAHAPDELDVASLRQRLADAEQLLAEAEDGSAAAESAGREKVRCEAFIAIAESS